jgi:hypothetical protein
MLQEADAKEMAAYHEQAGMTRGRLIVHFYIDGLPDAEASLAAGCAKFKDAEFIEIRIPGDKDEIRRRPVRWSDTQIYAEKYAAFRSGQAEPETGTPLDKLPFLSPAQVMEYKAAGLKTAENIRDIPDSHAQKFMGILKVRQQVNDFLEAAAGHAPMTALRSEIDKRDAENAALKQAIKDMGDKIEALSKKK